MSCQCESLLLAIAERLRSESRAFDESDDEARPSIRLADIIENQLEEKAVVEPKSPDDAIWIFLNTEQRKAAQEVEWMAKQLAEAQKRLARADAAVAAMAGR